MHDKRKKIGIALAHVDFFYYLCRQIKILHIL